MLIFEEQTRIVPPDPNRADIACFLGFVARRPGVAVPRALRDWLLERSLLPRGVSREALESLRNLPVPVDAWDDFDRLFAWDRRPVRPGGPASAVTYLGAAVRSFFSQGGRKCYVVCLGDPLALSEDDSAPRLRQAEELLPEFPNPVPARMADRDTWRGIGVLFGLPEVSFVLAPDLPELFASPASALPVEPPPSPAGGPEQFVECSEPVPPPPADSAARFFPPPRCDAEGYANWARAVFRITQFLRAQRREMQFIGALPLPSPDSEAAGIGPVAFLEQAGPLAAPVDDAQQVRIASAFVQLAYPWPRTLVSRNLPAELEAPDGLLAGVLARNSVSRGSFRSAAGLAIRDVYDVEPRQDRPPLERISILGPTPRGFRVLSDVTTSGGEAYRPGSVSRLTASIVRAARRLGEEVAFEPNGENLWARIRGRFTDLLAGLLAAGALHGEPGEAFAVTCDRSTMTQQDIDAGRAIAIVQFQASAPIERIVIRLELTEGGQVALLDNALLGEAA